MGRLQKAKAIRKPPFKKINQAKKNKNKKMIKTEIGLKFVFRDCLEKIWQKHVKKEKTANPNNKNHEQVYSTWSESFDVKKHTEHGLLRTMLIQNLIL